MTKFEKRCEDCSECYKKNGTFFCKEKFDLPCNDILENDCPLEIEVEEVEEIQEKTKNYKIQHGAKAEEKKERKKREIPEDVTKVEFIKKLAEFLNENGCDSVEITNKTKIVEFKINDLWYKIDLIRQRNKNKAEK